MPNQIVYIHGGETFATYADYLRELASWEWNPFKEHEKRWRDTLADELPGYEVLQPPMPNKYHARYEAWKIWFDKVVPHLTDDVVLIGHSLGGIFLAKYLSENQFPLRIRATLIVAAPFDEADNDFSLADFILPEDLSPFIKQGGAIHLFYSQDDDVVPFADLRKYQAKLPAATAHVFIDRGHFLQGSFPEIVRVIESLD